MGPHKTTLLQVQYLQKGLCFAGWATFGEYLYPENKKVKLIDGICIFQHAKRMHRDYGGNDCSLIQIGDLMFLDGDRTVDSSNRSWHSQWLQE